MKRVIVLLLASSALAACATTDIAPVAEGDGVETGEAELRGMLEEALDNEDYERASKLRDEIKRREQTN